MWLLLKRQIPVLYSEHSQRSKMGALCENNQRLKSVNHFRKKLHLRCLTVFWVPIQNQQQGHQSNIHGSFVLDFKHVFASSSCHCIIVSSLYHHRKTDPYIFLETDIAILFLNYRDLVFLTLKVYRGIQSIQRYLVYKVSTDQFSETVARRSSVEYVS